ncbi:alpha/beta hydrolase [Geodermatophilus sp. URMC 62]|uniref:alpha/beta hydrolase n=1 Tax=Geodermatophilus sp. URMC 62 TaxID=3423414 RepID=UPI00406D117A
MSLSDALVDPPLPASRSGPPRRLLPALVALLASALAVVCGAVLLGAYLPAVPVVGPIGSVLAGDLPVHVALLAVAGLVLALVALRAGLVRWGRVLTAATVVCVLAALTVVGVQVSAAARAGADVPWRGVLTQIGTPAAQPDETTTYARPGGTALDVDVYLPPADVRGATPAVVLVHGGGYRSGDRADLGGTGRWLAEHGVAVFAVDHRLATPTTPTWDRAPQDVVCALAWVQDDAARYGVDPTRVSLGGMSAGGALALGAAYRLEAGTIASSCGRTPAPPASVVGFYPVTDVVRSWEDDVDSSREAAEWFTGGTPEDHPERYAAVSPSTAVRPGLPPTLLVVGAHDLGTRPEVVTAFAAALTARGNDVTVEVLPFAVHAFDAVDGSIATQTARQVLLDFLLGGS